MTEEKLERAKNIDENLQNLKKLNWIEPLKHINDSDMICIGKPLYVLICSNETFKESFSQLIKETKERLQKEFEEL